MSIESTLAFPIAELTLRFAYVAGTNQIEYVGTAARGASDSDPVSTEWRIVKYIYDASPNVVSQLLAVNSSWAKRTTAIYM